VIRSIQAEGVFGVLKSSDGFKSFLAEAMLLLVLFAQSVF